MEKRKKPFRATFRQSVIGRYVEKCEGKNFQKFQITFKTSVNLVIGLQKRYDPSKTYYFIMDVVWSDGSQLMIYRHGQNGNLLILKYTLCDMPPVTCSLKVPAKNRNLVEPHRCRKPSSAYDKSLTT